MERPKFFVWMGEGRNTSQDQIETRFKELSDAGVDGVMYQCSPDRYPDVITLAKPFGLEVHAWQVILNSRRKDLMENHGDWFTINGKGESSRDHPPFVGYYSWLCPSNEEVQDYLVKRISKLAETEGLKSVHLDYIRYSDVILPSGLWDKYDLVMDREYPEFDFCYCNICAAQFQKRTGIDPRKLEDPALNPEWRKYRYDSISRLVNKLADAAHNRGTLLTAAVFPTPAIAKKLVRQDWVSWDLDAVYPMIYHSFYEEDVEWIRKAVEEGVEALVGRIPLYCGLYIPALKPDELGRAVDNAFEAGAAGICLFDYGSLSEKHWEAFAEAVKKY
jgi:uncharacterized lipoprotein YddW (UPF0748 family)